MSSCLTTTRVWRAGAPDDTSGLSGLRDLVGVINDPDVLAWVDLLGPTPEELSALAELLGLDPSGVEDALASHERPKLTRHDGYLSFTVYAASLDDRPRLAADGSHGRLELGRISGFVLPQALITVRHDEAMRLEPVLVFLDDNVALVREGSMTLVYALLDQVVDHQFEVIEALDDEIDGLEDELFEAHRPGPDFHRRIFGIRKDLVGLRRVVLPMREVVNGVLRHRTGPRTDLDPWLDDLYDHVIRAAESTDSLRDLVTTVFETNLSLQDSHLNLVMKKLAGWAAIIAVPTAITGWFGQNVPYWGFQKPLGLWLSVVLIAAVSGGLYVLFKRRDWL